MLYSGATHASVIERSEEGPAEPPGAAPVEPPADEVDEETGAVEPLSPARPR